MGSLARRSKLVSLFLPHRERFTRELLLLLAKYCTDSPIWSDSDRKQPLFLSIEFVEVVDSLLFREIIIGFKLADDPRYPDLDHPFSKKASEESPLVYRFELGIETEVIGEQTFLYTFTSIERLNRSVARFRRFIEQSYIPREQARRAHYERWREMRETRRDREV